MAVLLAGLLGVAGDAKSPLQFEHRHDEIESLAPVHLAASGFSDISGVAPGPSGSVFVTDRIAGTLTRIDAQSRRDVLLRDLHHPEGVAANSAGDLFVLETGADRLLHITPDGVHRVVAAGLRESGAVAVSPDDRVWLTTRAGGGDAVARVEPSGELTIVVSGLADVRALGVTHHAILIGRATDVVRVARDPGQRGQHATSIVDRWRPSGMAVDRVGDVYISGWPLGRGGAAHAGVVKYSEARGSATRFAGFKGGPGAVAIEGQGHLFLAEGTPQRRLWRFLAPPAPHSVIPPFTNESPLLVTGTAAPRARVQVKVDSAARAGAIADAQTGRFTVSTALRSNTENTLQLDATALGGAGLLGPAVTQRIGHDDRRPYVTLAFPSGAAYVRDWITIRGQATDEGSGIASLRFFVDEVDVAGVEAEDHKATLPGEAVVGLSPFHEGAHTLSALAVDRAGNQTTTAQLLVIDRTPPDTQLLEHPAAETSDRDAAFVFAGTDTQSPMFEFSWRLDAGAWSPYRPETTTTVDRLSPGLHTFEVRARDLAGNEDATPVRWLFQVTALRLQVIEPAADAVVATDVVWVRGTAEGAAPVVVYIPLAPELQVIVPAVTAPVVSGRFAVWVPLVQGQDSLAVTARDATGAAVTQSVAIQVIPGLQTLGALTATPPAGFAPHTLQFDVASLPAGSYNVDLESDGTVEYSGGRPDGREFTYISPGMFLATLDVVAAGGQQSWRAPVMVYDRTVLEAELRGAWTGFKDALGRGELEPAVAFVHSERREIWRAYLAERVAAIAGDIGAIFTDIDIIGFEGDRVECEMMRAVDGLMFSFPVTFALDADGRWRLWQF